MKSVTQLKRIRRRETNRKPCFWLCIIIVMLCGTVYEEVSASDLESTVRKARLYLQTRDSQEKARLAVELNRFDGSRTELVNALRPRPQSIILPGYYPAEHFSSPELRKKHPDDLLYFSVPSSYRSTQPNGLIVFMHGGGKGSPRTAPDRYMQAPEADTPKSSTRLGDLFEATGLIGVGPSAPWNENDHSRWCLPEADEYIADVIRECKERFNIDANRVYLMGHSMGGFGAYHQVQRQPDRFAAVIGSAGMWSLAHWPVIRGTKLFIVHGERDAEYGVRDRHTDIAFARWAHRLLEEQAIPHTFSTHPDGHSFGYAKSRVKEFLLASTDLRRDSAFPHVVLASPVGYKDSKCYPVRHNRWVTLERAGKGSLNYNALRGSARGAQKDGPKEDWDRWQLTQTTVQRSGSMIEAINEGENCFGVKTENVDCFSLWLNEDMVDFDEKIKVIVNGETRFHGRIQPTIATLLDSFDRRGDWSLVYPARITIDLE